MSQPARKDADLPRVDQRHHRTSDRQIDRPSVGANRDVGLLHHLLQSVFVVVQIDEEPRTLLLEHHIHAGVVGGDVPHAPTSLTSFALIFGLFTSRRTFCQPIVA